MEVYVLRNSKGEYISKNARELTDDWDDALKLLKSQLKKHTRYLDSDFKVIKFTITEEEFEE